MSAASEYRDTIRGMTVRGLRGEEALLMIELSFRMEDREMESRSGCRSAHRKACITAGRLSDVRFELELRGMEPQLFGCERTYEEEDRVLVAA